MLDFPNPATCFTMLSLLPLRFLLPAHLSFTLLILAHHTTVASPRGNYTVPAARCCHDALDWITTKYFFMAGVVFQAHHVRSVASIGGYSPCHLPVKPGVCLRGHCHHRVCPLPHYSQHQRSLLANAAARVRRHAMSKALPMLAQASSKEEIWVSCLFSIQYS